MNYIALYRKWRPRTFDEVVEQENVVTILKNSVKSGRIAHAYLFCGTRGTGKTSIAKIFSRAVNCLTPIDGNPCNQCDICKGILNGSLLDVSEIDAASNNNVDNIRNIIEESNYQATKAKYKVFIIDEVHMLSTAAFNALLKTLEEPPENVIFILATTEPHKLPVTILSRCQRYNFKRISRKGIVARLDEICSNLNIEYEPGALEYLAGKADGAMRDAISILDQTIGSCENNKITMADARQAVGSLDREIIEKFAFAIINRDSIAVLTLTDTIFSNGADPSNFICELIDLFRDMLVVLSVRDPSKLIFETGEELERLKNLAEMSNTKEIALIIKELSELENSLKWSVQRKIIFEAGMLSLCDRSWGKDTDTSSRILALERNVADLATKGIKIGYNGGSGIGFAGNAANNANTDKNEANPKEPEPEIEIKEPEVMPTAKELKEVSNQLYEAFIKNIELRGKPSISSLLKMQSKAYQIGRCLYISIGLERMMSHIKPEENGELFEAAASEAFGKKIKVIIEPESKFVERIPGLQKAIAEGTETEEDKKLREFEEALNKKIAGVSMEESGEETGTETETTSQNTGTSGNFAEKITDVFAQSSTYEEESDHEEYVDDDDDDDHEEFV